MKRPVRTGRRVLVVDDEANIRELLEMALLKMGLDVDSAESVSEAKSRLAAVPYQLCLTDMRLPDGTGLDLVRFIGSDLPNLPVAVITAYGSAENAVSALKAGAFDYLAKPVGLEQLRGLVRSALSLSDEGEAVAEPVAERQLLGQSAAMVEVKSLIERLARSQAPVYITGESGSGKELAARMIHERSARRDNPFIAVNCGAIPENLMESEFFGHRKGAFTGAGEERGGFFHAAHEGTLFLDEVADLPLSMQVKLLRAIQEKKVRRVGATQEEPVDVRIISATHQSLSQCVEDGRFRQDLYYRLNVIQLRMPALRAMPEDIPGIARSVLARIAAQAGQPVPAIEDEAMAALAAYDYPGNVRELENILERGAALCADNTITCADLDFAPAAPAASEAGAEHAAPVPEGRLTEYLDQVEKDAILGALEKTGNNKTAAAKLLGISFRALRYRMERLGLS